MEREAGRKGTRVKDIVRDQEKNSAKGGDEDM